jgi:hypothetical protein
MASEAAFRLNAENAIQADVDQNEADSVASFAAATTDRALLRTEAGNESAARVAAEGVIAADLVAYETSNDAALAAELLDRASGDSALQSDIDSTKGQLDVAGGFNVSSLGGAYQMGWGAGKPKMEFSISPLGVVTMSVVVG